MNKIISFKYISIYQSIGYFQSSESSRGGENFKATSNFVIFFICQESTEQLFTNRIHKTYFVITHYSENIHEDSKKVYMLLKSDS